MTNTSQARVSDEAEIRRMLDDWSAAVRVKDLDGAMAPFAEGVVAFDLIEPLEYRGAGTVRERLEQWFSQFEGDIGFEMQDVTNRVGDDTAFCYGLHRVSGTTKAGDEIDMWWRATLCWERVEGEWRITHEHSSVPFDMTTGQASMDLVPEYDAEQGGR